MTILEAKDLAAGYHGLPAIRDISATWRGGEFAALCGPNGSGKSTLLKVLAGLQPPLGGQATLDGEPVAALDARSRARRIAFLPPDGRAAWPMEARRIVALGRAPHLKPLRRLTPEDEAAIDDALRRAGATGLATRRFDELSSGERARILVARALATGADILLLDEPAAALDPRFQLALMDVLAAEAARGALVLIAAHGLDLVARYCSRVLLMQDGRLAADGTPAEALSEANLRNVFGVAAPGGVQPTGMAVAE